VNLSRTPIHHEPKTRPLPHARFERIFAVKIGSKHVFGFATLVVGFALCVAGLWLLLSPAQYQATTRIAVGIDDPNVYDPYFIQTELEIIKGQFVLGSVVKSLNLDVEWGKKHTGGKMLKTSETVRLLKRRLILRAINNSRFIDISVTDEDPVDAANIANAIVEAYRNWRIKWHRQPDGVRSAGARPSWRQSAALMCSPARLRA
jgi:capsular polysaccharide biosynthesis protein